jgi:hypothetical protein
LNLEITAASANNWISVLVWDPEAQDKLYPDSLPTEVEIIKIDFSQLILA